jgi:hypothetical protein
MCGRFTASFEFRQRDLPIFAPRYNIAPSQQVPVIVRGAPGTGFVQAPPSGLATTFNNVTYNFYYTDVHFFRPGTETPAPVSTTPIPLVGQGTDRCLYYK